MKLKHLTNSLLVAAINVLLAAIAFILFSIPRFTTEGGIVTLLILVLVAVDIILVLRDVFRSATRLRALGAIPLWLPVLFLFAMMVQWEGPLYVHVEGNPPVFEARGLAAFCGLDIYSPEQDKAEWSGDDIGLMWGINYSPGYFPFKTRFKYGEPPPEFAQRSTGTPAALDPNVTYKLVVGRCMGGAQYFALRGNTLSEYKPTSDVCWGDLKVPEREQPALVRVDCTTKKPLPMSPRAQARLQAYRRKRIVWY